MIINIPGTGELTIDKLLLDYNGTLAVEGQLLPGVKDAIERISSQVSIFVITADTYGSVQAALDDASCKVITIGEGAQDQQKLAYLNQLGPQTTMAVGNGRNDTLMLEAAIVGVALVQGEGVHAKALLSADLVCSNILDVFRFFSVPDSLKASLRN
ncbi:MAG: HAD family hydrolase [Thiotrichales bacterium]